MFFFYDRLKYNRIAKRSYLIPQIIGVLLGRYFFWVKYGQQEWRRYAMVLSVGFGVGMSVIGMFAAALAMINKAVSSLQY